MDDSPFTFAKYAQGGTPPEPTTDASPFTFAKYAQQDDPRVTAAQNLSGNQDYNGYCQTFVEKIMGTPKMGATAADAWNNWVDKGSAHPDAAKAPAGSAVYFAPDASNKGAGHVAIADGKGSIIGATDNGVAKYSLTQWTKTTGQKPLGYVTP